MTNEDKNKFDALEQLRAAAWESFDKRRPFEWRVCIALWTAFAAFIGALVTGKGVIPTTASAVGTTVIALTILVLHYIWLRGLGHAHEADKHIHLFFNGQMMDMLGVQFPEKLATRLAATRRGWGTMFANWNHLSQIGVTAVLALSTIITIWSAVGTKTP